MGMNFLTPLDSFVMEYMVSNWIYDLGSSYECWNQVLLHPVDFLFTINVETCSQHQNIVSKVISIVAELVSSNLPCVVSLYPTELFTWHYIACANPWPMVGDLAKKNKIFWMDTLPILSNTNCSNRCQYNVLKVLLKNIEQNLPIRCIEHQ